MPVVRQVQNAWKLIARFKPLSQDEPILFETMNVSMSGLHTVTEMAFAPAEKPDKNDDSQSESDE